jgi:hypothetical protein
MKASRLLILVLLGGLPGCAELQQLSTPHPQQECTTPPDSGVALWLAAESGTRDQSPEQQQQTLVKWEEEFQRDPDINHRMQLILLLANGAEGVRDSHRARRLLDGIDPLPDDHGDREFITLMQQRLDDQSQSARKLDILWKQVTEQNRRIEELEQQLQELTNIEQNIQNRDAPTVIERER